MLSHPVFRATKTMRYLECPELWWKEENGWGEQFVRAKDTASCLGTAFHAAAAHLVLDHDFDAAFKAGKLALDEGIDDLYFSGRILQTEMQMELAALPQRYTNAVKCLNNNLGQLAPYDVVATELTLPAAGNTTIDVVLREKRTGLLSILDWKCKTFSRPYYRDEYIKDMAQSWQLKHYTWGYGVERGEHPVSFIVGLVDLTGKAKLDLLEYEVYDAVIEQWYRSARQAWEDMAAIQRGERQPIMRADHRSRYGLCPAYHACFE